MFLRCHAGKHGVLKASDRKTWCFQGIGQGNMVFLRRYDQRRRSDLTMLSRHSVGTYQGKPSSDATRQETLSHSRLISLSHCGLILALKKRGGGEIGMRELIFSPHRQ